MTFEQRHPFLLVKGPYHARFSNERAAIATAEFERAEVYFCNVQIHPPMSTAVIQSSRPVAGESISGEVAPAAGREEGRTA